MEKTPPRRKIRIGYYTTDVFVNDLFNLMLPVYRFHDKEQFEVYIFSGLDVPLNRKEVQNLKKYG